MDDLIQKVKERFSYVPEDKIIEMIGSAEVVMMDEGEILVREGERTNKAALVLKGMMRNFIINDKGEEVTVVFATETQVIMAYATLSGRPASETTVAVEPSILIVMDFMEFRNKVQNDHIYARLYADLIETSLIAAIERIEDFTKKNPEQRYLRLLETHGFLIERAPLKFLASYLGITAVSLSRIRKRLARGKN